MVVGLCGLSCCSSFYAAMEVLLLSVVSLWLSFLPGYFDAAGTGASARTHSHLRALAVQMLTDVTDRCTELACGAVGRPLTIML